MGCDSTPLPYMSSLIKLHSSCVPLQFATCRLSKTVGGTFPKWASQLLSLPLCGCRQIQVLMRFTTQATWPRIDDDTSPVQERLTNRKACLPQTVKKNRRMFSFSTFLHFSQILSTNRERDPSPVSSRSSASTLSRHEIFGHVKHFHNLPPFRNPLLGGRFDPSTSWREILGSSITWLRSEIRS